MVKRTKELWMIKIRKVTKMKNNSIIVTIVNINVIVCIYIYVFQHYVSERKVDEDVSRTTRFIYDSDHMSEVGNTCLILILQQPFLGAQNLCASYLSNYNIIGQMNNFWNHLPKLKTFLICK